jgi:hypothetical protein
MVRKQKNDWFTNLGGVIKIYGSAERPLDM